jgi:hypothetical protein
MSGRIGGNIIDTSDIEALIKQGEESQKAREEAMEKRRKEEEDAKKAEEMKKLSEDTGTSSQTARGKGV